jgi:hypothetical protein
MTFAYLIADSVSASDGVRLSTALLRVPVAERTCLFGGLCATTLPNDERVLVTGTGTALRRFIDMRRFSHRRTIRDLERALDASAPACLDEGEWHLPFIDGLAVEQVAEYVFDNGPEEGFEYGHLLGAISQITIQVSVARCAALAWSGEITVHDHVEAYRNIINQGRFDATEHQATPDGRRIDLGWQRPHYHGRLPGWQQYRKMIVGENLPQLQHTAPAAVLAAE